MIKFRAWDKKNKRWMTKEIEDSEESEIRLDLWGNLEFKLPWWEQVIDGIYTVDGSDMFDIMQSTGLKDKNSVEIYEGDIVRAWSQGAKGVFAVKWRQGGLPCWILYPAWQNGEFWKLHGSLHEDKHFYDKGLEVIGNIYENPELLEVSEW